MKIKKFIFKFIDHERSYIAKIMINVYCDGSKEWVEKPNDVDYAIKWAEKMARQGMALKEQVKQIVSKTYFSDNANNGAMKGEFADYRLIKEKISKEAVNVNLNSNRNTENVKQMKEAYCMEKCIFKMVRGEAGANWTKMLFYPTDFVILSYKLADDETDRPSLTPVPVKDNKLIVFSAADNAPTNNNSYAANDMTYGQSQYNRGMRGGANDDSDDYKEKYMKYKKKYMDMKTGM